MVPDTGATRSDTALLSAVLQVLLDSWQLSLLEAAAVLGRVDPRTLLTWRECPGQADIGLRHRQRLVALLRLHKRLRAVCPVAADQCAWLRAPATDGDSPLTRLEHGDNARLQALMRMLDHDER